MSFSAVKVFNQARELENPVATRFSFECSPRVGYPEGEEGLSGGRRHVNASWIRVLTFGRDDAFERLREREVNVHVVLPAHHL